MLDVKTQLRGYGEQLDATRVAVEAEENQASPTFLVRVPSETQLRVPRPGWLIAAASAAVVVLMAVVVALAARVGSEGKSALTQPAPSPTISPEVDPTTTLAATPEQTTPLIAVAGWSRVPDSNAVFGGTGSQGMMDVIAAGPGFVAVGHDRDDGAVWTSADGITWSRVPHDEAIFGGAGMGSVTVGGPGLVAVGGAGSGGVDGPAGLDAVVWTSVDGMSWSRVADDDGLFGGAWMVRVTVGGPGLVAVGLVGAEGEEDAAVWTSGDGFTWSRVPHDEAVFGGPGAQRMLSVTAGGPGLVAVGGDYDSTDAGTAAEDVPAGVAAVWTSPDGIVWSRIPHDESVFGEGDKVEAMHSVTAGGPGLVAVGFEWGCRPFWTSIDGVTWSRVPNNVPGTCNKVLHSVIAEGTNLFAVGHSGAMWTSADGITWTQISDPQPPGNRFGVTARDSGLVAVGAENWDAAVWVWNN